MLTSLPKAHWPLSDRIYDADLFRDALQAKGITPCILERKFRTERISYDKPRYELRNRIEIMFGRVEELAARRRAAPRSR